MSECNTNTQCKTDGTQTYCAPSAKDCGCPATQALATPCCPVEFSVQKWTDSIPEAMHAVSVDLLKDKIRKAWGPVMEKEAEAVVAALGASWQAACEQSKAAENLRTQFKKILDEACKK